LQPFRITCETCRSRLKIRSADVIGQIHACPKCGSMVQVVPPPGWDTNYAAMTADQSGAMGDAALSLSTTASVIIPAGALDDMSAVAAALEAPPSQVPVEVAPSPVLPPADFDKLSPGKAGSPVLLWAAGGIVAAFLVGGLAWVVWPAGKDKARDAVPTVAAKSDQQPPTEQSAAASPATPAVEQPKPNTSDAAVAPPKTDVSQAVKEASPKPAAEQPVADPAPNVATPADTAPPAPAPVAVKTNDVKATDTPTVAAAEPPMKSSPPAPAPKAVEPVAAPDHSPVLKFDPLDFDVDRLGANAKAASDSATSTGSIPNKALVDVAGNSLASNDVPAASAVAEQGKQPAAGEPTLPHVANNGVMVRRGPPGDVLQRTAAQILGARVKSFQVSEMPLVRFIDTISGVAGMGITLDPLALEQVGISPEATVSVNAQDAPLQSILHEALAQRRLDIAGQGGQLRVVLPKADEPHAIDYDVKDLAAGADAAAAGQLIEHFVAPPTWKSAGGKGTLAASGTTLHIEQSDAVRRQVVVFCERLRLARSLAIQSKYPAAMLSVESPYQHLSAKLSEHTTFTFLPWTRLDDVARNWQELSGLRVLVDWSTLAEAELGPSSSVACSALDRSWQESLDGVLEPLGLGWWAVDGETIQITSVAALEKIQRVEFYHVPAKLRATFASNQALVDSLQKELAEDSGKLVKPLQAHIEVDGPSGRLIVLATPTAHRHLSQRLGDSK
jgi:hypothetical protein